MAIRMGVTRLLLLSAGVCVCRGMVSWFHFTKARRV